MVDRLKTALRRTCRQIRENLSPVYQQKTSSKICQRLQSMEVYRYAKHIALYHASRGEVNLDLLWESAPMHGKFCYFPAITDDKTLLFLPATPVTPFEPNRYGIPEPAIDKQNAKDPDELDLIIMPLVAFDSKGTRLGMGGGYYDKTLANKKNTLLIGLAYEFQHTSYIEPQPWDVALDAVVTQRRIYWFSKKNK